MDYSLLLVISEGFRLVEEQGDEGPSDVQRRESTSTSNIRVPFYRRYQGGIPEHLAKSSTSSALQVGEMDRVLHLGIIDLLQEYNLNKKTERWIKVNLRRKDPEGVSCVDPDRYANRFNSMVDRIFASRSSGN
eukprot:TRINITY_DN2280_c0_g1_i1.p1 TRINITY_DN2280_c0_g1~~TRINITY_DN2280_c0_g1_i1.p1  ORF type:complete len:133 (+),score=28.30 TRINITY_DN2280_c0_g1_i1:434-832(+)